MSFSLARRVLLLMLLSSFGGCSSPAPTQVVLRPPPDIITDSSVTELLSVQVTVGGMTPEQINTELAEMEKPDSINGLFYFGLLNQQSDSHDHWIIARDIFRQLQANDAVISEQRQLAAIFEKYNQSRINWYQRYSLLQQKLLESERQTMLLEQKIQAITDLESTISTRKEQ